MSKARKVFKINVTLINGDVKSTFMLGAHKTEAISSMETSPSFVSVNGDIIRNSSVMSYTVTTLVDNTEFISFKQSYEDLLNGLRLDTYL